MMVIALGANLDHNGYSPAHNVRLAMNVLDRLFTLTRRSGLYQSPAWPDRKDPPFINAVVVSDMKVPPSTVLKALHSTEAAFGRHRERKNAPRTMDLDLLAVDDMIIRPDREEGIYLPHPSMAERDFVLVPLVVPQCHDAIANVHGPIAKFGFGFLGIGWFTTTWFAYTSARAKNILSHRRWMIRSYALTLAVVSIRPLFSMEPVLGISTENWYLMATWACWVPNLIMAEIYIRATQPTGKLKYTAA